MDHNASKRFPPIRLMDVFHQIRNNRFDKEGGMIAHAFRNMPQTFVSPATPNNRNEALSDSTFCFGISGTSSGFAAQRE
jgi:hypothetical protein